MGSGGFCQNAARNCQTLNDELNKVLRNPDVASKLSAQGIDLAGGRVDKARNFIELQIDIWAKVVKDNNIKPG